MKTMYSIITLMLLVCFSSSAQTGTVIPLPGFQANLKEFPTTAGDTITAEFFITDFSNKFRGQDILNRQNLVVWRNCQRYKVVGIVQVFSTAVKLKLLKGTNKALVPGYCALLQETPNMVSHLISGITDSDNQCIDSYYRVQSNKLDTLYFENDTLGLRLGSGRIFKKTELLPNIVAGDTIGFFHIVHIGNYSDTTLVNVKSCGVGATGLNLTEIENLFNGGNAQGASVPAENVGINTTDPEFTLDVNAVDGIRIPIGTTAQRPLTPKKGVIRFNTTRNRFEGYNGNRWVNLGL